MVNKYVPLVEDGREKKGGGQNDWEGKSVRFAESSDEGCSLVYAL